MKYALMHKIILAYFTRTQMYLLIAAAVFFLTAAYFGGKTTLDQAVLGADEAGLISANTRNAQASAVGAAKRAPQWDFVIVLLSRIGFASCSAAAIFLLGRSSNKLRAKAQRDSLTGLLNRLTFSETLASQLRDPGSAHEVALILLDVDRFKEINDTLGHAAGDELLKEIAHRLGSLPKAGVNIARLGGDEFAIILAARSAYREATNMANAITKLADAPFLLDGKPVKVSVSLGVASAPMEWCDADTLLRHADIALYHAKKAGRGAFRFFDPKMYRELQNRRELENDLRHAIERGELDVYFQPIVDLKSNAIVSCEALARWRHPRLGFVSPLRFISLAEDIGFIQELGSWILARACAVAQTWPDSVRVSINLSSHQFDGNSLIATVARVIDETGIAPGRIELEITETTLLRETDHVLEMLASLKKLGVRIALDDFGTGYSSLSYLHRFPIDKIKIDQSFVREIANKPEAAAIIESINLLAGKLGLVTTAEGIETEAHTVLLRVLGCDEGQGYYFDKPLTAEACLARLGGAKLAKTAA
jgi:diguanylate cyclase (GGDEF)-like protein